MHGVLGDVVALYRQECAGSYVQANILNINMLIAYCLKYSFSKMKSCRRGCHRAFDPRIKRLIAVLVYGFGCPVQIGRNRHLTAFLQHFRETFSPLPGELHNPRTAIPGQETGLQIGRVALQNIVLPAL